MKQEFIKRGGERACARALWQEGAWVVIGTKKGQCERSWARSAEQGRGGDSRSMLGEARDFRLRRTGVLGSSIFFIFGGTGRGFEWGRVPRADLHLERMGEQRGNSAVTQGRDMLLLSTRAQPTPGCLCAGLFRPRSWSRSNKVESGTAVMEIAF